MICDAVSFNPEDATGVIWKIHHSLTKQAFYLVTDFVFVRKFGMKMLNILNYFYWLLPILFWHRAS